jgi:mRNA-degrading endonuclease HigB of HigAB toxin-antitoxin module
VADGVGVEDVCEFVELEQEIIKNVERTRLRLFNLVEFNTTEVYYKFLKTN